MAATTKTLTPTNETISIPAFTDKPDNRLQTDSTGKLADAVNALSEQIGNKMLLVDEGFITSAIDLDDVTDAKTFAWSGANKGLVSNKPFDDAATVFAFVMGPSDNRRIMMICINNQYIYARFGYGINWTAWWQLH